MVDGINDRPPVAATLESERLVGGAPSRAGGRFKDMLNDRAAALQGLRDAEREQESVELMTKKVLKTITANFGLPPPPPPNLLNRFSVYFLRRSGFTQFRTV